MVEVRHDTGVIDVPSALTVHTYLKPSNKTIRLADIQWWRDDEDGKRVVIHKIAVREPMTKEAAMEKALGFAEEHGIPLIYEKHAPDG